MRIYMVSFIICGFNMFASAWFTALNNGPVSALISFTRTLVFELGCVFVLPLILGIDGIWLAVNVAEVLALALSAALVLGLRHRYGY
jgi:Na+-driven multidrug efflux pump